MCGCVFWILQAFPHFIIEYLSNNLFRTRHRRVGNRNKNGNTQILMCQIHKKLLIATLTIRTRITSS